jgi:hypothetical protein
MIRRGVGRNRPGVMGSLARTAVIAGTASAVAQAQRTAGAEALRREQAAEQASHSGPDPDRAERVVAVLKELAALRSQGALTDEEFAVQKARLLA